MSAIPDVHKLDPAPMVAWLLEHLYAFERNQLAISRSVIGADVHLSPQRRLLRLVGWDDEKGAGTRRLYRWLNEAPVIDRRDAEDALRAANVHFYDVYPDLAPKVRRDRGRSYVCTEDVLARAHTMHLEGMSVRAVARALFDECFSASPNALATAFLGAWHARGWEVRSRVEATALSNVQRAWRPQCGHVIGTGRRKGQRCQRSTRGDDQWCWHHHPERIAAGVARLREVEAVAA